MKGIVIACAAWMGVMVVVPASAQAVDYEFKPIDTNKLVVQPSKTMAHLAAGTINLIGQTTAESIANNGYIKTINNLFSFKRSEPKFQAGPSALPSPNLFKSTYYPNYNTPVMPRVQTLPRR
ncbi:MAG: hypothetical protein RMJ56_13005 [Gemmataceae bacterium]|nr:hypothetical protein [Gemmata sp.]MDW8198514.1 hypothetical protein [Gemmataceae bacterium]